MANNQYDRIFNIIRKSDSIHEAAPLVALGGVARGAGQVAVKGAQLVGRGVVAGGKLAVRGLRAVGRTVSSATKKAARKAGQSIKRRATDKVTDVAIDRAKQKIDQRLHANEGEDIRW